MLWKKCKIELKKKKNAHFYWTLTRQHWRGRANIYININTNKILQSGQTRKISKEGISSNTCENAFTQWHLRVHWATNKMKPITPLIYTSSFCLPSFLCWYWYREVRPPQSWLPLRQYTSCCPVMVYAMFYLLYHGCQNIVVKTLRDPKSGRSILMCFYISSS